MTGIHRAPDGARVEYNTESTPGCIVYYDANGVRQRITSGYIRDKDIERASKAFKLRHPEQRELF